MEAANYKDCEDMIQLRIKTKNSYQIKRILEAIEKDKDLVLMSKSRVGRVKGENQKLRLFASIRDLKEERNTRRRNNRRNKSSN